MGTTNILDLNNRVDEMEKSYPATQVMMSDGVTSVEDALDEAEGDIESLNTVIDVTSEITKNITVPSGKNLQYNMKKCGRIVEYKMWSDFDIDKDTTILTIPSKYLPINLPNVYPNVMYITDCMSVPSTKGMITISQTGVVKCALAMGGWQMFEMTWICS